MRLTDFKVLTFDCYGTLIDWETVIVNALRPLVTKGNVERSREELPPGSIGERCRRTGRNAATARRRAL
jgi:FMN phosphatase YigB (HAD superfamily)